MIRLDIEPIESYWQEGDPKPFAIEGYEGTLSVTINGKRIDFRLGGKDVSRQWCVEKAQAILYGIASECKRFADNLENKTK